MKKSLIALAALAATSAFAQSSVTMYGNFDVGYGAHKTTSKDGTAFTKTAGVMDGSWAGSRLGFRGTEDMGGGLKANFLIEQGINVATAKPTLAFLVVLEKSVLATSTPTAMT